ncbi:hypothetical protein ANN_22463 [Periplaneta americana]|uniref:Uncharacterized protein n=1 Tax=Periplaneta americana TaxID=6978 RepID=A0ABQ8S912_PERAM|nr:hypothetical protein ANN_22463 [Periplaneta americana]
MLWTEPRLTLLGLLAYGDLRQMLPNRVISQHGNILQPTKSFDLTACDFFFGAPSKVFTARPSSMFPLNERIEVEIEAIPQDMLRKVMVALPERDARLHNLWWLSSQAYCV